MEMISAHPILTAWAVLMVIALAIFLPMGYRRSKLRNWRQEDAEQMASLRLGRIQMRNRFQPERMADDGLADQILADQAAAHEKPGAPAPDADPSKMTFYHESVSVGKFTFVIGKGG